MSLKIKDLKITATSPSDNDLRTIDPLGLKFNQNSNIFIQDKVFENVVHKCHPLCSVICINPLRAKFFRGNINIYLHFVSFLHIDTMQVVEILPLEQDKNLPILHNQYHGCWCPGDVRSQGISSHDIDLVKPR